MSKRVGVSRAAMMAALLAASCAMVASCTLSAPPWSSSTSPTDELRKGFNNPPNSARPRVWWHWMNGNVTKDGIQKDIEWMSRVGIGGLQNFDVDLRTPQVVPNRLVFMSPEWKDAFRHAARLADENGLELAIASSPGWSETGGPWVRPQDAIKKLVWSESLIAGGQRFQGRLPEPPRTTGRFADLPLESSILGPADPSAPQLYGDIAVIAYRLPDGAAQLPSPRITTGSGQVIEAGPVTDGSLQTTVEAPRGSAGEPGILLLDYPRPVTVRSLTVAFGQNTNVFGQGGESVKPRLEVSTQQGGWRHIADIDVRGTPQTTISFAPVTASRFRLVFAPFDNPANPSSTGAPGAQTLPLGATGPMPSSIAIRELHLRSEAKVNRFEVKAGFGVVTEYYQLDEGLQDEPGVVQSSIVDLTSRMSPDGRLDWIAPPGPWKVLRLGYSLTGTTNHPTTREASGLEVDKLDGDAVRRYLATYLGMYRDATGADLMGSRGLQALLTDSIEVGAYNWTSRMLEQFQGLRGYDARPWLPALTGAVIGSRAQSDAFLYDYRRTLADLLASEHYGTVAKVAREHGLRIYGEALEDRRPGLGDDLAMRRHTDVPMAALWTYDHKAGPRPTFLGDMKGAASVAHVYGQNLVAAESLTSIFSPWAFAPRDLKGYIDLEFVLGVNRPVIHTSVHQPLDDKQPGFSLYIFGQYFNRHDTWAEMAKPWVDYLARSGFMLQQGRNVADVAYFIGEERPATQLFVDRAVNDLPRNYAYDLVNGEMVRNELAVDGQNLKTSAGARYRVLFLGGDSQRMTLPVLKSIAALVEAGATVVGSAPSGTPSLADDPQAFAEIVRRLWSGAAVTAVGRGQVIAGRDVEAALRSTGHGADFSYDNAAGDREILFLHRGLPDADIYFVSNRKDRAETFDARFRVVGKTPEIWRADTGASEAVTYRIEGGQTHVSLDMRPHDAFFVVFRKPAKSQSAIAPKTIWRQAAALDRAWDVAFQSGRGAPASTRLDKLSSLSEHSDPGVRYFSGVATYRTSFSISRLRPGQKAKLDLGRIGDVAEVSVNGAPVGTVWNAPYQIDVTSALRNGENDIEVKVANLWVNRLIGDAQPGAQEITFVTVPTYKPDAPLRPSGLIGPVELLTTP